MATSLGINSTSYAGEAAAEFTAAAMLSADSIEKGYLTVHSDVKHKLVLQQLSDTGGLIDAYACDFANADDLDLNEAVLTPTELMTGVEICHQQFHHSWMAMQTGTGFANAEIPSSFEDFLLLYIGGRIAEAIELNAWQGNYDPSGTSPTYTKFSGICALVEAHASSVKVDLIDKTDGSTQLTALAVAEDVAYNMGRGVSNLPLALKGRYDKVKIFVSPGTFDLYWQDMAAQGYANLYNANGELNYRYNGYEIIVPPGFPDDTILLGNPENFHFGCDTVSDFVSASVVDMQATTGDKKARIRYDYKAGCQITNAANIVMVYPDAA